MCLPSKWSCPKDCGYSTRNQLKKTRHQKTSECSFEYKISILEKRSEDLAELLNLIILKPPSPTDRNHTTFM